MFVLAVLNLVVAFMTTPTFVSLYAVIAPAGMNHLDRLTRDKRPAGSPLAAPVRNKFAMKFINIL